MKVTDFFGNVQNVELTKHRYPLLQDDEEEIDVVLENYTVTKPMDQQQQHLFHSFMVEKSSKSSMILGMFVACIIGYAISTSIMI